MSLLIDQSWVKDWDGKPTVAERDLIVSWLATQDPQWKPVLSSFPPFCIVKAKKPLEVPYQFTVGLVAGYYEDGRLAVSQEPRSEAVPVNPEDVEVVGFWKGLTHWMMKQLL